MKHNILIRRDGTMCWLTAPPIHLAGSITTKRFSEIVPRNPALRLAFRALRKVFGETGKVSDWTRSWHCMWRMTVLETGFTDYSMDRASLITQERELFYFPVGDM